MGFVFFFSTKNKRNIPGQCNQRLHFPYVVSAINITQTFPSIIESMALAPFIISGTVYPVPPLTSAAGSMLSSNSATAGSIVISNAFCPLNAQSAIVFALNASAGYSANATIGSVVLYRISSTGTVHAETSSVSLQAGKPCNIIMSNPMRCPYFVALTISGSTNLTDLEIEAYGVSATQ